MSVYRESYAGSRIVESMADVRTYPVSLPKLREQLWIIELPVSVLFGRNDPVVPPAHAEILRLYHIVGLSASNAVISHGSIDHPNTARP